MILDKKMDNHINERLFEKKAFHFIIILLSANLIHILFDVHQDERVYLYGSLATSLLFSIYTGVATKIGLSKTIIPDNWRYFWLNVYCTFYYILLGSCFLSIVRLADATQDNIQIPSVFTQFYFICLLPLSLITLVGVVFNHGVKKMAGGDYFLPSDKQIIYPSLSSILGFDWVKNPIYSFLPFLLYFPGFIFHSKTALISAGFHHLSIWLHYMFTDLPETKILYPPPVTPEVSPHVEQRY